MDDLSDSGSNNETESSDGEEERPDDDTGLSHLTRVARLVSLVVQTRSSHQSMQRGASRTGCKNSISARKSREEGHRRQD